MILAMDIGTTFLKVAVIDFNGTIYFFEKSAVAVNYINDIREVNPDYWNYGLKRLCSSIPDSFMKEITSVVISGNGPTIVPVDSNGDSIGNAFLWMDTRAESVTGEIHDLLGEYLPPNFFLSKAYWVKKDKTNLYNKTSHFLSCPEYISYLFTGRIFTLLPQKGFIDFYWNRDKILKLGMDPGKFPDFISPYEVYGEYDGRVKIPGLKIGTPIICAGPDFTMSVLGTGSIEEGIVCDRTGTSEGINFCSRFPRHINGLRTLPHIVDGLYTISGLIPDSGNYVMSGMYDSLIEEYRSIIQNMLDEGLSIQEIRIVGGHARIPELNKKKAACFPVPLRVYPEGSELIGNSILGSVVTGYYQSIEIACSKMIREEVCYNS